MINSRKIAGYSSAIDSMNFHFHARRLRLSESVKRYAIWRLAFSLGRSQRKVVRIDLHFNHDGSNRETECQVRLQLQPGQGEISAQEIQSDIYQAAERAITRATRSLERQTMIQDLHPGLAAAVSEQTGLHLQDFDYELPANLIAHHPLAARSASRLLHVDAAGGTFRDAMFVDLPGMLRAGDLLVVNDSRVIKARLRGEKESGGKVEILIERVIADHCALAQVRASKPPKMNSRLRVADALSLEVVERQGEFYCLRFPPGQSVFEWLERFGETPLPPYIERAAANEDTSRYQTVFAQAPGSVAAPTAGLHFDEALLERLQQAGIRTARVTLHVGAGTFQPVRVERINEHRMHSEWFSLPQATVDAIESTRQAGGRVIAVGTTSLRTLESAARDGSLRAQEGETTLFISPGFKFRVVDCLITNFHLPRTTLMMLVCAFGERALLLEAYRHAVASEYRFFSYGDAMLIERDRKRQADGGVYG